MRKDIQKLVWFVILALALAGSWALWQYFQVPTEAAGFASGNGRIEAIQIDVSTKIPGRVQAVLAQEGDLVKAGQTLAKIDTDQLQVQLMRAEAEVAKAESQVISARASITQATAQQALAKQELFRAGELVKKDLTSREDYDTRVSQLAVATAILKAAEAMLVSSQRGVDATLAGAMEIQTQIDDCVLISPTIGRVLYRLSQPGEVLGSGGKVLTLINLADIYMEVFLPSAQAHRIAIGAEARIKLDVLDYALPAAVSFVSPESQFTPKQVETSSEREKLVFRVKLRIPQQLVVSYIDEVKTGVRGVAYIRLIPPQGEESPPWPLFLQQLPVDYKPPVVTVH
jgi:HlyD family secretion protein